MGLTWGGSAGRDGGVADWVWDRWGSGGYWCDAGLPCGWDLSGDGRSCSLSGDRGCGGPAGRRVGHGAAAWAVGDDEGGGLSRSVGLAAVGDLGCLWAEGGPRSHDLGGPRVATVCWGGLVDWCRCSWGSPRACKTISIYVPNDTSIGSTHHLAGRAPEEPTKRQRRQRKQQQRRNAS